MSNAKITAALEVALDSMAEALPTAWENVAFNPPDTAYQEATFLFAAPENPTLGADFYRQTGIFNIALMFPLNVGKADVTARGELIRQTFKRGSSFVNAGVTVKIDVTPEIPAGKVENDRFVVRARVRFYAEIYS